jgi:hypothetical protein
MPFDPATKTAMFIRCHRRCCLCHKPCGTKIEAAHIIDESAGGSNEEDNGIPLCFDCHQDVGSYNDKHPKGNKYRPEELRARRDQVYKWVAEGKFLGLTPAQFTLPSDLPNPLHRIIDLLIQYHSALGRVHEADTRETRLASLNEWSACHPAVWEGSSCRNDVVRRLADPAKEWLSQIKSSYVKEEHFNLVELGAYTLSSFLVSSSPMSNPDVYSKRYSTEESLWQEWTRQGEQYRALGDLIARLQELSARAGQKWNAPPPLGK